MTVVQHPGQAMAMLALFACLEALLVRRCGSCLPKAEVDACRNGLPLLLLVMMINQQYHRRAKSPLLVTKRTDRFRKQFAGLSLMEVVFTLVLPWVLLLVQSQSTETEQEVSTDCLLVPHLFIFQSQIAGELIIASLGQKDLLFPYTCVANLYRGRALYYWLLQAYQYVSVISTFQVVLPLVATLLWMYSSFVFIPIIWYPCLETPKQNGLRHLESAGEGTGAQRDKKEK